MRFILTTFALILALTGFAQKKDTLVRFFNSELEPVKKKQGVFAGVVIKDPLGWNALVYNDSLKVIMRGKYEDNECLVKNGWFIYYNSKGDRYLAGRYENNIRTDVWQTWYPSGQPKDSVYFVNNAPEGLVRRYFPSGQVEMLGFYKAGVADSNWTWYHENGQIATKEKYAKGKLNSFECFDSAGNSIGMNCAINRPPAIKGKYGGIEKYLTDSLANFDKVVLEEPRAVEFQVSVDRNGVMSEPAFMNTYEPLLNSEVTRVLKSIPGWYPAVSHNRTIDHTFMLSVRFLPDKMGVEVIDMKNIGLLLSN